MIVTGGCSEGSALKALPSSGTTDTTKGNCPPPGSGAWLFPGRRERKRPPKLAKFKKFAASMASPVIGGLAISSEIHADQRSSQRTRNVVSVPFQGTALGRRQDRKRQTDQCLPKPSDRVARTRFGLPFSPSEPLCKATSEEAARAGTRARAAVRPDRPASTARSRRCSWDRSRSQTPETSSAAPVHAPRCAPRRRARPG